MWQPSSVLARLTLVFEEHDAKLVVVAALICVLACYTALTLIARAGKPGKTSSDPWLTAAAVVIGCGVWAVHFVTLLAFQPGLRVGYDAGEALLAAGGGIACTGLGFAFVVRRRIILGGAAVGAAATLMNYLVMAALRLPAHQHWDVDFVAASFLIGTGSGAAALWLWRRRPEWSGQFAAALLLTGGVLGTHFVGMAGLGLTPDPALPVPSEMIPPIWFSVAITAICLLIVGLGVIGSLVDQHIGELEATKGELERTAQQLRLAVNAASAADQSKSQFLASMSHELRTPLNAILGFSELLRDEYGSSIDPGHVRDYATNIFDSGRHLLELIDDILDLSKLDAGHLDLNDDAVDLGEAIASCLRLMEPHSAKANVRIHANVPDGLPSMRADDRRLRQVLLNLLSNAVKFTPGGGRVDIAVSCSDAGIAISVSDTGIGMAPGEISIALERFGQIDSRLSRKYTGTGLGLPLSKHLVELHGGALTIVSAAGQGTTVTALFPRDRVERVRMAA
ncbi:MAG TPA: ATP-binding protein [Rhizomicrobium sp.]|jgi:signal transduction histidine kinase|nr:ATP-binding protein [Rhizomicrobium sp.]